MGEVRVFDEEKMKIYVKIYIFKKENEVLKKEENSKMYLKYLICNYMNIHVYKVHVEYF